MDARLANLAVRFALEIVVLVALAAWGFNVPVDVVVRVVLGLTAPLAVIAVWGTFVSPKAPRRLPDPARLVAEGAIFAIGALAFIASGQLGLGLILAVAAAVSLGLMVAWGQRGL